MKADLAIVGGRLAGLSGGVGGAGDHAAHRAAEGAVEMGAPVDVVIDEGRIAAVVPHGEAPPARCVLDASDAWVMPGLVDIQVHFRTPGGIQSEDIASGAAGAAMGGVTACLMMPNTNPPIDTPQMVHEVLARAADAPCDVRTSAAITLGRAGERLADLAALHGAGVRVFTDDGDCVADADLMAAALSATTELAGAVISQHAEDPALVGAGVVNEGAVAERLGLAGRPAAAEIAIVERDIELARRTGGRYHVLHLSTAAAMDLVREAKRNGVAVTAEVTPQHLVLTEEDLERLGSTAKMNPPLRLAADVSALRQGLIDGALDAVATDHAPHHPSLKDLPLAEAAPGMIGVETMASVVWTELVRSGEMTPARFVEALSVAPARIASIADHGQPIAAGSAANVCVFDPAAEWTVEPQRLQSRSLNTPWAGRRLVGRVRHTVLAGRPVVIDADLVG